MKSLFLKQEESKGFFVAAHTKGQNTLDTSSVGTGKTVVAAHLALDWDGPVAVICPKAVVPSWERELKEHGVEPCFVLNYEKIRNGRTQWMSKKGKKLMTWNLPPKCLVFIDEIHACKSPFTQNAQMLISLVQQGYRVHGMSATAAEDPTEMRALGFMLGLHNLNKDESWFSWMKRNGCVKNDWNQWICVRKNTLPAIKEKMYSSNVKKLTVKDFPDSFKHNRVFVKPIQFSSYKDIIKAYDELGITPEIIDKLLEDHTVEDSEHVLVNLLDMAEELRLEGNSVVLFVNFSDTVDALCTRLDCLKIDGRQTASERQEAIDSFQEDKVEVLVVNIAAGGTGISLHDVNGERPRVSLISPTFSAKHYLQCLGRIHRNGAKSDAVQQIIVAADSIEEHVVKAINKKIQNMEMLHGN
jgi:hypothetical protein